MKTQTTFSTIAGVIVGGLLLAACSPLHAMKPQQTQSTAKAAVTAEGMSDAAREEWLRNRAAYERSLDISTIASLGEYRTKRALAEAKYYLELAYMDLLFSSDKYAAVKELDKSLAWLDVSLETVGKKAEPDLLALREKLKAMRRSAWQDAEGNIEWLPVDQRATFDEIKAEMERLIQQK